MVKGTPAMGKKSGKESFRICRRCGKKSLHVKKKICSSCGFGKSARLRTYKWKKKSKR